MSGNGMNMICQRCLIPVTPWRNGWKHVSNQYTPVACNDPQPVERKTLIEALRVAMEVTDA